MKTLIATFTLILFSHTLISQEGQASYNQLWAKVHKLEKEVLTKSALEVVQVIWEKAKKEKNSGQVIKSLLFKSKYALILEEDAQLKVINGLKSEISTSEFPVKNVLESYLANLYWQYFQQNRYQFYNRTTTNVKVDSVDFRTWDLTTLFKEITGHFEQSLQQPERLQKEKLKNFEEILYQQEGSETYRPTLFDVLAHTALQFFRTDETSITRPADKFQINDPELLCEAYSFTQLNISTSDSTSLQAKALQVYQELVAFHFSNPQLDALVAVDIERLKYIYSKAVFSNKDQYFLEVLQQSAENLKHHETAALYQYEIVELLYSQGNSYTVNPENQWKLKEAIALCDAVYANFPDSRGAKKCAVLRSRILATNLQLTAEKNVPNNQPSRLLVNYKNHDILEFRACSISKKQLMKLQELYPVQKQLAYILNLDVKTSWTAKLKNEGDYQNHSIEVPMPALTNGRYVILATPAVPAKKDINEQSFAFSPIQVTDFVLSETKTPTQHLFQVVDRNNGKSKKDAKVTIYYKKNYRGPMLSKNFTTDANGFATMDLSSNSIQIQYTEVTYKEEKAFFEGTYINQKQKDTKKPQITYKTFLFKDRSIYRPGQPIYFKGILMEKDNMVSKVASEESLTVGLYDANGQKVSEMDVATNDFGSFTGEFLLPSNGLTGQYYIKVYGVSCLVEEYSYFSVEEYKRPKFETSFIPVEGTFRVNDSIIVKGAATAFAGSTISGAKVNYRIQRTINYPQWYYWSRSYYGGTSQEIAHGETSTDNEGNFKIKFKAIPDTSADKKGLPVFNYTITADVTDINGETRSTATTVRVGYHAMEASILVGGTLDKSLKEQKIYINTQNLNGQKLPAKGVLKIHKLKAPDHVLRNRPWQAPDYQYWGKKDFKALYPHDAYAKENDPNHWEKGKLVFETKFDTGKSEEIDLKNFKKWGSGQYIVALETTDAFGQKVEAKTRTSVFDEKEKILPDNQLFQVKTDKTSYGVGDMAEVTFYSNAKDSYITVWVEKEKKIIRKEEMHLNEGCESISVPVTPLDRGGFTVHYNFTVYNSFRSGSVPISVPYPSSDLEIETLTFRDKLQPGTDETWSFKIKGPKGEKVVAELLANMYDASLDKFRGNYWDFSPIAKPYYYSNIYTNANQSFGNVAFRNHNQVNSLPNVPSQGFDRFEWFGLNINTHLRIRGYASGIMKRKQVSRAQAEVALTDDMEMEADVSSLLQESVTGVAVNSAPREEKSEERQQAVDFDDVQIRKNLQETAFFFPQLTTDKEGNVSFSFTTPEALTRWNLQLLAYTKDLKSAIKTLSTVTQKELMVLPNPPRFLREGDAITISSKISNLSDKNLEGFGQLELTDALTGKQIDSLLGNVNKTQNFSVDAKGNTQLSWKMTIPEGLQAVQYKIVAKAGEFSDGEQNMLPVLTNRMLVTETMPMWIRSNQTKTFTLNKLRDHTSTTLKNHKLTLEITSNPAWYAVQALPYLMEYPYECNEQTFSRYYANSLATHIANSNPRIQEVFDQWANSDALLSNLEKNQELKSLLIQETPWLRDAQSETEQKKRIALLFNLNKMKNEQEIALRKLQQNQMASGAWPWFKGGRENRYITQHIITGLGHLQKLTVGSSNVSGEAREQNPELQQTIKNAIAYLDNEFVEEYQRMKNYATDLSKDHLSNTQVHYLYMRSFFKDIKTSKKVHEITAYYQGQAQQYWTKRNLYSKGMLALILQRMGDTKTANKIIRSLKENSIVSDEMGMYWKANTSSWYWYQAPIETQSLLIEAFSEIENDTATVDNLKIWLLKNKQTNQWKTTKATTEAVYALLLQGSDWLSVTEAVDVLIGGEKIEQSKLENVKVEAGTGYYKTAWNTIDIKPEMGTVTLSKKGNGIAWGALYWQYFEDLDNITSAETPLQLKKKLFLKKNTDTGEEISEITTKTNVKVGDLIRVRIELRTDRHMEFLHMKDMRAAGFEPVNVFSQYKWQDGLGYYESTKDASTNFFFDDIPKGVYVFEYDVRVNNAGVFSNGITTIQSMYAPEFSSHSEGIRVNVGDR